MVTLNNEMNFIRMGRVTSSFIQAIYKLLSNYLSKMFFFFAQKSEVYA